MNSLLNLMECAAIIPIQSLLVAKMLKKESPVYTVWLSMRGRCNHRSNSSYPQYGGRGITICKRWGDFWLFVEDMGPRPEGYTLDRIDNDGPYSPENCRWASKKIQQRNQRWTRFVNIGGARYKAVDLAETIGIKTDTLVERVNNGWPLERIMKKNVKRTISPEHKAAIKAGQERGTEKRTHCRKGHEYSEDNTKITKEGWRICRTCAKAKSARRREAMRVAKAC